MTITAEYTGTGSFRIALDGEVGDSEVGGLVSQTSGASGDVWYWRRDLTGVKAVGASADGGYSPSAYMFDIFTDDVECSDPGDFSIGFRVRHLFGGSNAKGGREALSAAAHLTAPTNSANPNRNYVAVQGKGFAEAGDGGTNLTSGAKGAIFGGGFAAYNATGSTNMFDVAGAEFNTFTQSGSSARFVRGVSIALCNAVQGSEVDAFISMSGMGAAGGYGPHSGSKHGLLFHNKNGADPISTTGTVIGTAFGATKTVGTLIDFSEFSPTSGNILLTPYTRLTTIGLTVGDDGVYGTVQVNGPSAAAHLRLLAKGGGAIVMSALPTNPAGFPSGTLYKDASGFVKQQP